MNITITKYSEIDTLKGWFPDKEASYLWCGPGLRFPFTQESFLEDIYWGKMPTYSLLNAEQKMIGFGQYYEKLGRCHLARLVISPLHRAQGIGQQFISQLMGIGMSELEVKECSLFVVRYNENALKCYKSLGFRKQAYPTDHEFFKDIDFMVYKNS